MTPAKTLTPNPSTTAPAPPMAPVTVPPNRAGGGGAVVATCASRDPARGGSGSARVKHSRTNPGAARGSAYAEDTITCTNVGTESWPRLAFTSATASTTARDRSSRLESPEAKRIRGAESRAGSENADASAETSGGAGDDRVACDETRRWCSRRHSRVRGSTRRPSARLDDGVGASASAKRARRAAERRIAHERGVTHPRAASV
jgi:hypothetical protein